MRAEAVKALQELEDGNGDLEVASVVAAARPQDSPLHRYFTWDDTLAAARYREAQARHLIGSYQVAITTRGPRGEGEFEVLSRGYAAASRAGISAPPGTYRPISRLTPVERAVLLQTMRREIAALRHRYSHLAEFWEEIAALSAEAPEGEAAASG